MPDDQDADEARRRRKALVTLRRRVAAMKRKADAAEAKAAYWKAEAIKVHQEENDRRASLGIGPIPFPKSLTE